MKTNIAKTSWGGDLRDKLNLKFKKILFLLLFITGGFFVLGAGEASAATYYVDCAIGNDSTGNGSVGSPWKSMAKADISASDGDSVDVSNGPCIEDHSTNHCLTYTKAITWNVNDQIVRGNSAAGGTCVTKTTANKPVVFNRAHFQGDAFTTYQHTITNGTTMFNDCTFDATASIGNDMLLVTGGTANIINSDINIASSAGNVITLNSGTAGFSMIESTITASLANNKLVVQNASAAAPITFAGNTGILSGVTPKWFFCASANTSEIVFNDNILSSDIPTGQFIACTSGGGTMEFLRNNITLTSVNQLNAVVTIGNQSTINASYNTIDTYATSTVLNSLIIQSLGNNVSATVTDNIIKNRTMGGGHGIIIGSDSLTSGNNHVTATVMRNKIYGAIYFDPSAGVGSGLLHGYLLGYISGAIFRNNSVYGSGGYGLVVKHEGGAWSYGDISDNLLVNSNINNYGIYVKGFEDVPIYNNIIWVDPAFPTVKSSVYVGTNTNNGGNNASGTILKNNIIVQKDEGSLVKIETNNDTGFVSDYNLMWNSSGSGPDYVVGLTTHSSFIAWQTVGYDANSINASPLFTSANSNDFNLQSTSPAIDSGTSVGLTSDYAGNPIYGTPDIGAYEYQPPHTIGTDKIDIGAGARIYGDGKFRDKETTNSNLADLTITPQSGNFNSYNADEVRPEWLDIKNITWNDIKQWTEASPNSSLTNTLHTVGDLEVNKYYNVSVDDTLGLDVTGTNCTNGICKADSNGKIAFTYTGTYSEHTFQVEAGDNTPPVTTASPDQGQFSTIQTIILTCTDEAVGCDKIYYTTDGTNPTTSSTEYSSPINISSTTTLKFFSADLIGNSEEVQTKTYTINTDNSAPTLTNNTSSKFSANTTSINLSLTTDENSTCHYSDNSETSFDGATPFATTGETFHSSELTNLTSGYYLYYAICRDSNGNESSYTLEFEIAPEELKENISSPIIKTTEGKEKMKNSTIYSDEKELKLQGEDSKLASGTIKIYKNSKLLKTVQVNNQGKWSKKIKLSSDFSGYIKVKQYNQYGTLIGENKTKIKVDKEKPEITSFPNYLTPFARGNIISWEATDDKDTKDQGIDKYKIYLGGNIYKTKNNSFTIPTKTDLGLQYLRIRAYDKAGNSSYKEGFVLVK